VAAGYREGMTGPDVSITVSGLPGHPVVGVSGELDFRKGVTLADHINLILDGRPNRLTLDLSGVGFCGSGSVSALVAVHQAAKQARTDLDLVNVPRNLERLLELSGVLGLFNFQRSADPAS
jgi:anti-sigma B factor antagonist